MSDYRRWRVPGASYFFTVNLCNRRLSLLTDHVEILRMAFRDVKADWPFHIDAIVILPEHLHTIWTLPLGDDDYPTRWRMIKEKFTRKVPVTPAYRSPSRRRTGEQGIWQRRYWEHTIRDEADFANHVDYIHINPVKHGHVRHAADWPHSSIQAYIKRGTLPADWTIPHNYTDMDLG